MATKRMLQLGEQIRQHISIMIVRGELADPRIKGVVLNSVRMSPDLSVAKVYLFVHGDEVARKSAVQALNRAAVFVRRSLGAALLIRHIPEVIFHYDDSTEQAMRVGELLTQLGRERRVAQENENLEENNDERPHVAPVVSKEEN